MRAKELRAKPEAELEELIVTLHREQFNLKMQKATGQLAKPDRIREIRRDIARVYTIASEKRALR